METNDSIVPLVDQVKPTSESLGARMYSSLMGTFDFPAPINYLGSTSVGKSITIVGDRIDLGFFLPIMNLKCPYWQWK